MSSLKRLLFDWHVPDFGRPIRLDIPSYLQAVDRIRPSTIYLMSKSAFGCTYYDDVMGYHNASFRQDLFGDLVEPLRQRGIEVIAYFNVTLNDIVAKEHPEWHQVSPDGRPIVQYGYHQMCMNQPYRDLLYRMMTDIAEKYLVDGFWFDLAYVFGEGCFCDVCRESFRNTYGVDLTPKIALDPEMCFSFHEFRRKTRRTFLAEAIRRLREIRPSLQFGFNHAGDVGFSEPDTDELADWSTREFHPPGYKRGAVHARYMRNLGKPFELMLPESLGSWGDWTIMSHATMQTMAATAVAHGGAPIVGHVAYPSDEYGGKLAEGVVDTLQSAFRLLEKRENVLEEATSIPVGACLFSVETVHALQAREGLKQQPGALRAFFGAADLLADNAQHFDILNERNLKTLSAYEYLLLGEPEYISETTMAYLQSYAEQGGVLIAFGKTSLSDRVGSETGSFAMEDLLGVQYAGESEFSVSYLERKDCELSSGLPEMPLLLKAAPLERITPERRCLHCRTKEGTEVLATFSEPCLEPDYDAGRHIYHLHAPPANKTAWPAITLHRVGKGATAYIAGPLGEAYAYTHSPWLRKLVRNLLHRLGVPRTLNVEAPAGIDVSLMRQKERWLLHLIPQITEHARAGQIAEEILVEGVRVRIGKTNVRRVVLQPGGEDIPFTTDKETICFSVPPFCSWTTITID